MPKKTTKNTYYCKECGYEQSKWTGQCPICKAWDSFVEAPSMTFEDNIGINRSMKDVKPVALSEIEIEQEEVLKTGMTEFDNLLGGGIVKGSMILIGGAPGIGKSTLLLQIVKNISDKGKKVLYVSGEESLKQIKLRALRIGQFNDNVQFLAESNLNVILAVIVDIKPDLLIIDSIQTMTLDNEEKTPGGIGEVRACTAKLFRACKECNVSSFIVGHITKDGLVAGPKLLEHMVDTVLYFEDDQLKNLRLLRCKKNRFGSLDTLAVFEMEKTGLKEIKNPSEIFLMGRPTGASGCVVTCVIDANRPILLEVQALVTRTSMNFAIRKIDGGDLNRLNLLIAIIEKRMNLSLSMYDIYVNITGGFKTKDTSIDLAIIMAIISSYRDKPLGNDCIYCGEVGLSGEVRRITNINMRVKEATKLGYKKIFLPKINVEQLDQDFLKSNQKIEIKAIENVAN